MLLTMCFQMKRNTVNVSLMYSFHSQPSHLKRTIFFPIRSKKQLDNFNVSSPLTFSEVTAMKLDKVVSLTRLHRREQYDNK